MDPIKPAQPDPAPSVSPEPVVIATTDTPLAVTPATPPTTQTVSSLPLTTPTASITPAVEQVVQSTTPSDPLTEEIEKDLVAHIIENLEGSKLTVEQAQMLAEEFLALLPFQDKHDLVQKLNSLSEKYNEAKAVYVKYAGPIEEEERQKKIAEMAAHIKAGNLDQALAVVKGGTNATNSSSTV